MATVSAFLNVNNIDKSIEWYAALGFKLVDKTVDAGKTQYAELDYDGVELGLGWIGSSDDEDFKQWVSTPLGAGVLITFQVDDVDEVHAKASDFGAEIEFGPVDRPYGRTMMLNDPDGYSIYFLQPK